MPTYNSVTITFTNDWVQTDQLYMLTQIGGVTEISAKLWEEQLYKEPGE